MSILHAVSYAEGEMTITSEYVVFYVEQSLCFASLLILAQNHPAVDFPELAWPIAAALQTTLTELPAPPPLYTRLTKVE